MTQKLLFLASYPTFPIGYSRIGNILSNYFANHYEVFYLGFSNHNPSDRNCYIDPRIHLIDCVKEEKIRNSNETFGVGIIEDLIREIKPDIVFIYNDIIVSCRLFNKINSFKNTLEFPIKIFNYLDLVYDYENPVFINHVNVSTDKIIVFSEHWKNNLIKMQIPPEKLDILYHGFDSERFYPLNVIESKRAFGFSENDFVILNTNRNTFRKGLDLTISAFIRFLKRKKLNPNIKLILNCDTEAESGYNLLNVIKVECFRNDLDYNAIVNTHIHKTTRETMTDERMNVLYNASDIGINTCIGEGFGLCNLEHGGIGKPQIVSNVGGLRDIFKNYNDFVIDPVTEFTVTKHTDEHSGIAFVCKVDDFTDRLEEIYNNYEKYRNLAGKLREEILERFIWGKILGNLVL